MSYCVAFTRDLYAIAVPYSRGGRSEAQHNIPTTSQKSPNPIKSINPKKSDISSNLLYRRRPKKTIEQLMFAMCCLVQHHQPNATSQHHQPNTTSQHHQPTPPTPPAQHHQPTQPTPPWARPVPGIALKRARAQARTARALKRARAQARTCSSSSMHTLSRYLIKKEEH